MFQDDFPNALHGTPVFFFREPVAELAHILHGKLPSIHPIQPLDDESHLALIQFKQPTFSRFDSKTLTIPIVRCSSSAISAREFIAIRHKQPAKSRGIVGLVLRLYVYSYESWRQIIKDPETEARELQNVLNSVGKRLRANIVKTGKLGVTYAEFKAKKGLKALPANGPIVSLFL